MRIDSSKLLVVGAVVLSGIATVMLDKKGEKANKREIEAAVKAYLEKDK